MMVERPGGQLDHRLQLNVLSGALSQRTKDVEPFCVGQTPNESNGLMDIRTDYCGSLAFPAAGGPGRVFKGNRVSLDAGLSADRQGQQRPFGRTGLC
jgi:hypothetical protein